MNSFGLQQRCFVVLSQLVFLIAICTECLDPNELDCGMRLLFLEKAQEAVPWRTDMRDVFKSLELSSRCGETYVLPQRVESRKEGLNQSHRAVYVCPHGNDCHTNGNETHPFQTIRRALSYVRRHRKSIGRRENWTIVLGEGIHFLKKPILLTEADSYLTIKSATGKRAWVSGGTLLESPSTHWKAFNEQIMVANLTGAIRNHDIASLFTVDPHERMTLARYPNANVEWWNSPNRYIPSGDVKEWIMPPFADVPQFEYYDLSVPNPTGLIKNDSSMAPYNTYGTGRGGACATVWGPEASYWCSNTSSGGWAFVDQHAALAGRLNLPRAVTVLPNSTIAQRMKQWKRNPRGAILHVSHTQGWSWHMWNVSNMRKHTLNFDKGGWQGGRNWQCKDGQSHLTDCNGDDKRLQGGDWYIEGVLDELDAPGEFFFDKATNLLYFYPPAPKEQGKAEGESIPAIQRRRQRQRKDVPDLVAANLKTLIKIRGTIEHPVRGIRLIGLGFRDAAKTYMEQWSAPSGGDWALHRGGAVFVEGARNTIISDCNFHRLDGNAIMLSGYCRDTQIARCDFSWLGNGAMATWGHTDGYNSTRGEQPRFSVIEQNVVSNIGLYQKQSSGWGQNKACQSKIRNNIMFDMPRAAINFNDGLGGGNLVEHNVIFNTCRESGDHGPINSWDRMPFLSDTTDPPSFSALPTHTTRNIILANYGASQGFDNDDGSSWYHTHDNVYYDADGFKMDYGGHDSRFTNNLVIGQQCFGTGSFLNGHQDVFENNTCILYGDRNADNTVGSLFQCSVEGMNPRRNHYFTSNGNATWWCEGKIYSLRQMQKQGFEPSSDVHSYPDASTILKWAKNLLSRSRSIG